MLVDFLILCSLGKVFLQMGNFLPHPLCDPFIQIVMRRCAPTFYLYRTAVKLKMGSNSGVCSFEIGLNTFSGHTEVHFGERLLTLIRKRPPRGTGGIKQGNRLHRLVALC
eukprot:scpid76287/ scgid29272/ 